jgi:aerobic C4-dicarboxylate transport protein
MAGAGFITLAATMSSIHTAPIADFVLLFGFGPFVHEAYVIANLIGNAVAAIGITWWGSAFDTTKARRLPQPISCRDRRASVKTDTGRAQPRPTAVTP